MASASAAGPPPHWLTVSTEPAPAVIDGRACRTRAAFFDEAARVLRLPGYFGRNWDALADSLRDATRTGTVTLIVAHAEELLSAEPPEQLGMLLAVLADAADAGLTMTLCTDPAHEAELRQRVADAP
jgi:RNAse (barnase) inhibitor barstar